MIELEYLVYLDDIVIYISGFGSVEIVRNYIENIKERLRLGKVVSIFLDLGERVLEWML